MKRVREMKKDPSRKRILINFTSQAYRWGFGYLGVPRKINKTVTIDPKMIHYTIGSNYDGDYSIKNLKIFTVGKNGKIYPWDKERVLSLQHHMNTPDEHMF